ncbi:MAG: signal peptidase I [Limisphaerales bacterium]
MPGLNARIRWFHSQPTRHAFELLKHVRREYHAQFDLLAERPRLELKEALDRFDTALNADLSSEALKAASLEFEHAATKWLQPYPNASSRDNLREFLVSAVFIMTVFTFFVQPMKIPSGSAQPTLYGNVTTDLRASPADAIPNRVGRFFDWFRGIDYHQWTAKTDGVVRVEPPSTVFRFIREQSFQIGKDSYSVWWPPDNFLRDCGLVDGQSVRQGDTVLRLKISSGDRLFIDRMTFNFRRPELGETIVFTSTGVPLLTQHTHYIKRLVALSGDRVRIGNDRHLRINGERLDASDPGFELVYGFKGPPRDSVFSGHVNELVANQSGRGRLAPLFRDESVEFTVRRNHYLTFGDNTMNSYDGRAWGDFPREKVVGRALCVFWPFTGRFGPVHR